jgi:SAM-dependent methyltransferase
MANIDWSEYYKGTAGNPPNPLLEKALTYLQGRDKAIDLGAGALNETCYLLKQGFDVTTVDQSPLVEQRAKNIGSPKLHSFTSSFEEFNFPMSEYDLAVAMFALPFIENRFSDVFTKIKLSLKEGGIFCGQFFGNRDQRRNNTNRTFHTKEQVMELLNDLEVLSFEEEEKLKGDMNAHIFHVIARKKYSR